MVRNNQGICAWVHTKHVVKDKGGQSALSFFCMHLDSDTVVNNEKILTMFSRLCLKEFDTSLRADNGRRPV